jgi:hypothetical protein
VTEETRILMEGEAQAFDCQPERHELLDPLSGTANNKSTLSSVKRTDDFIRMSCPASVNRRAIPLDRNATGQQSSVALSTQTAPPQREIVVPSPTLLVYRNTVHRQHSVTIALL